MSFGADFVGIVGGGLGGIALAVALEHRGISWRLFERAAALRTESTGALLMQSNGMTALAAIHPELPGRIRNAGAVLHSFTSISRSSENGDVRKAIVPPGAAAQMEKEHGHAPVFIAWRELHRVLRSMLPEEDDRIQCGCELADIKEGSDHAVLRFSSGRVETVCLAVGCDGSFSAVRNNFVAPGVIPRYFGQMNWSALFDEALLPEPLHQAPGRSVMLSVDEPPIDFSSIGPGCGKSYWRVRIRDEDRQLSVSGHDGRGGVGLVGVKERLLQLVANVPEARAAIAAVDETQIQERSIYDCPPLERWSSPARRVVLAGDAAHSMHSGPGQGANYCFEDIATLAAELSSKWPAVAEAVEAYEVVRIPRAHAMQLEARRVGEGQMSRTSMTTKQADLFQAQSKASKDIKAATSSKL